MINGGSALSGKIGMRMRLLLLIIIPKFNMPKAIKPIHPGEILQQEFLIPLALSQYRLAKDINVPPRRINEIIHGTRSISADTALRLAKYFANSPEFWLNLQNHYDLATEKTVIMTILKNDVKIFKFAA